MKKILIILTTIFLLVLTTAAAKETWVNPQEEVKLGDLTYMIDIDNSWETIAIMMESSTKIMSLGQCKEIESYEFCINETDYNLSIGHGGYYQAGRLPAVRVITTELTPKVSFKRTIEDKSPYVGDINRVEIILKNTGNKPARNVYVEENVPESFSIIGYSESLDRVNNTFIWEGTIYAEDQKTLYYTYKTTETGKFSTTGEMTYEYDGTEKTVKVPSASTSPKQEVTITTELDKDSLELGESITFTATIDNTDKENELKIPSLTLSVPKGFDIDDNSLTRRENDNYIWDGEIEKKGKMEIIVNGTPQKAGNFSFRFIMDSIISNRRFDIDSTESFAVNLEPMQINISTRPDNVKTYQKSVVSAVIKNPNEKSSFKNIICQMTNHADIADTKRIDILKPQKMSNAGNFNFMSENKNSKDYLVRVDCTYETIFGEEMKGYDQKIIKYTSDESAIKPDKIENVSGMNGTGNTTDDKNSSNEKANEEEPEEKEEKKGFIQRFIDFFKNLFS